MMKEQDLKGKFDRGVSMLCWGYNEEDSISEFLQKAVQLMDSVVDDYEIVMIDDGSTDRTYEIASEFSKNDPRIKIFRNLQNMNVGASLQTAIKHASNEFLFWQTIDWCYDISNLRVFLEYLKTYNIVQGVRVKPPKVKIGFLKPLVKLLKLFGIKHLTRRSDTVAKALISLVNYFMIRFLFRTPVSDFQNVTFYPSKWVKSIERESKSSFTNPEGLIKAYWKGMSIKEVAIDFIPRKKGVSRGTRVRDIKAALKDILKLWFRWTTGKKKVFVEKGKVYKLDHRKI